MTRIDSRRRALLNMRKTIRVHRHFDVELTDDGKERQTCRECICETCTRRARDERYPLPPKGDKS